MDETQAANAIADEEERALAQPPPRPPSSISDSILPDSLLANPLEGLEKAEIQELGRKFVEDKELGTEYQGLFQRAAMLAQNPLSFRDPDSEFQTNRRFSAERDALDRELTHKWGQPKLYALVITCALAAAVQGYEEAAVGGGSFIVSAQISNIFYEEAPSITRDKWAYGFVNWAPHFCCALIGCWLTEHLNHFCGRRGAIFILCVISSVTCLGQGFTQKWPQMLVAGFLLGLGIGPKSATIPVYESERTPSTIRRRLVIRQMWTALGATLGLFMGAGLFHPGDSANEVLGLKRLGNLLTYNWSKNWRFMIASPMFCPLIVCALIYFSPESPRWYIKKGNYKSAFETLKNLRHSKIQAAQDLIYINALLDAEKRAPVNRKRLV